MCPYHPGSEPDSSFEFSIVFDQPGVVERVDLVEHQREPKSEVTIELHRTVLLEQGREELHAVAEIRLMVVCVLHNDFASLAGYIKPFEQALYRVRQHPRNSPGRCRPR